MQRSPLRLLVVFATVALLASAPAHPLIGQAKAVVPAEAPRPARELMDAAVVKAAADHKNVLVKFSASWCGPCRMFDRFLNDTTGAGQIMRDNFVIVGLTALETQDKVALENPGAAALSKSMGGDLTGTGIPFFFILDGTGKKLGDSNVMPDKSNIGYPEAAIEVIGFDSLLMRAAPHMTAAQRAKIKVHLDSVAGRKPVITP